MQFFQSQFSHFFPYSHRHTHSHRHPQPASNHSRFRGFISSPIFAWYKRALRDSHDFPASQRLSPKYSLCILNGIPACHQKPHRLSRHQKNVFIIKWPKSCSCSSLYWQPIFALFIEAFFWWSESERACIEVYFFLFAHSYSAKENFISILLLYT